VRDRANPLLGPQSADEWDNIIPYQGRWNALLPVSFADQGDGQIDMGRASCSGIGSAECKLYGAKDRSKRREIADEKLCLRPVARSSIRVSSAPARNSSRWTAVISQSQIDV
jgi:hypothetical protein